MELTLKQQHELDRRRVWTDAWCATANANDCKNHEIATNWADAALKAYDNKFDALREVV